MYCDGDLASTLVDPPAFDWQAPTFDCGLLKDWGNSNSNLVDHHQHHHHQHLYIDTPSHLAASSYDGYGSHGFQDTPVSVLDYVHQSEPEESSAISQQQQHQQQHQLHQQQHDEFGSQQFPAEDESAFMDELEIQQLLAGFSSHQPPEMGAASEEEAMMMMLKVEKLAEELGGEISTSNGEDGNSFFGIDYSEFRHQPQQQQQQRRHTGMTMMHMVESSPTSITSSQGSYIVPKQEEQQQQQQQHYRQSQQQHFYVQHQQEPQQSLVQQHRHQLQQEHQFATPKVESRAARLERLDNQRSCFAMTKLEDCSSTSSSSSGMEVVLASAGPQQQQQHFGRHHQQQQQQYYVQLPPLKMDDQLQLVRLLLTCANAVADRHLDLAAATLVQLRSALANGGCSGGGGGGATPMQRLASYVSQALAARLNRDTGSPRFRGLVCDQLQQLSVSRRSDMLEAFGVFYEYIPIGKFTHLTMNQMLLEASEGDGLIHVVDFQVWYGAQWPSLLQSLAMRPRGPPASVRMTAVGASLRDLQEAGAKLVECAKGLGLRFEYCIVNVAIDDFDPSMVELRDGEALLVNSLSQFHCFLRGEEVEGKVAMARFLAGIRSLRPKLVVMAENDADHNSPAFLSRFMACLQYYSAVFDAFDASLPMPGAATGRDKLEELIAAQKLRNMIACEGSDRVERHESLKAWSGRMEAAGFRAVSLSNKAVSQANLLLHLYFADGYTLSNQDGFLTLGWRGMPLNGVAAWIC